MAEPAKGLSTPLVGEPALGKKPKTAAARLTVATSDARMAKAAMEIRNRRASVQQADLRAKRATVATDDARLMEARRDDSMVEHFMAMAKMNHKVEEGIAHQLNFKKIKRNMARMTMRMSVAEYQAEEEADEAAAEGQSDMEAVLNMLNTALGTGLLALAATMMKVGLFVGIGTMILSAILNSFTLMVHIKTCRIANCDASGATLGEVACGRAGFTVMTFSYVIICFFGMVSYVDVSAQALQTLLGQVIPFIANLEPVTFKIVNWAIILVPGTFLRELGGIAIMSLISFIGAMLVLATILVNCGSGLITNGIDMDKINFWPESLDKLLAGAPVLIFCYALQAGGGIIISSLKDNSPENQAKICRRSFMSVFSLEIVVSLLGYLFFLDKTPSEILEAFPATDILASFGRVGVLSLVICGYVMLNVPTRVMLIQLIFNKNEGIKEASYFQFFITVVGINVGCLLVGLAVTDLSLVIGISGSVVTPLISFILPALFAITVRAKSDDPEIETPMLSLKNWDMYGILVFGVFCWILFNFGLVMSTCGLSITNDFKIVKAAAAPAE